MEMLAAGVPIRALGDADDGDVAHAKIGKHLTRDRELAGATIDQDKIGAIGKFGLVEDCLFSLST
jgi:hypothetical protein